MPTRIAIVSDTHLHTWGEIHPEIKRELADADIAVHCGDFVRMDVIDGMRQCNAKTVLVHGNSDPIDIRNAIPYVKVLEIEGKRIGITHPAWGGPEFALEELLADFPDPVDAIVFGHLHETINEVKDDVLFLNPGQGYSSFMVPATIAILTVDDGEMSAEIKVIEPGR